MRATLAAIALLAWVALGTAAAQTLDADLAQCNLEAKGEWGEIKRCMTRKGRDGPARQIAEMCDRKAPDCFDYCLNKNGYAMADFEAYSYDDEGESKAAGWSCEDLGVGRDEWPDTCFESYTGINLIFSDRCREWAATP